MRAMFTLILFLGVVVMQARAELGPVREITDFTMGDQPEIFASIVPVPGGGALMAGFTSSTADDRQMDAYLAVIDAQSQLVWENSYGDSLSEEFYQARPAANGGYIAVGTTNSYGGTDFDFYVVRLDDTGNVIWYLSIDDGDTAFGGATQVLSDLSGGWYVGGFQSDPQTSLADFRVIHLDDDGNIFWDNIYGGTEHDWLLAMCPAVDSGIICAGSTHSFTAQNRDGYVMKIDPAGNQVWQRVIGGPWPDYFNHMIRTSEDHYILVGTTHTEETSEQSDMLVVALNDDADILFSTTIGGDSWDEGWSIVQMTDRGYFCVGSTFDSDGGVMNGFGVRLDGNGNILWTDEYGDLDGYQEFRDVMPWTGDQVKAVGYTSSTENGDADYYTRILDASEQGIDPTSPHVHPYAQLSRAYPNPFNSTTVFSVYLPASATLDVNVYNLLGQEVRNLTSGRYSAGRHQFEWHADNHASGTYIIEAKTDQRILRQRVLLVK